jgi:hypothetical protein
MSDETTTVTEPEDDATIVHDPVAADEKIHDELVADVTKMLEKSQDTEQPPEELREKEEKPSKAEKPKDEKPAEAEIGDELQARAEGAGISKELAQRLHQSGQLEETLAAFDRTLIERFQSKETETSDDAKGEALKESPPKAEDQEDAPELDDGYTDDFVERDAYHNRRIKALESQVAELLEERDKAFDDWFDGVLKEMGYDVADEEKCQKTFKAYCGICEAYGKHPKQSRDEAMAKRAHAAMFPEEVFKKAQRQTVDRLRDAEGRFLPKSQPRGAPPAKDATEEEIHEKLVSDVTTYLKEQGVQMSGV